MAEVLSIYSNPSTHMRKQHWLCAVLILSFAASAMAQEFTSRQAIQQNEALWQDFLIQGEYLAETDGGKLGLHLIANGGGEFRVVAYLGGLPGDGWNRGMPRLLGAARVNGNEITFNMTEGRGVAAGQNVNMPQRIETTGRITITQTPQGSGQAGQGRAQGAGAGGVQGARPQGAGQAGQGRAQGAGAGGGQGTRPQGAGQGGAAAGQFRGNPVRIEVTNPAYIFEKQFRQSPTLGMQPPAGAIVLFDGTNLDMFRPGAQMIEQPRGGNTLRSGAATRVFEDRPYRLHVEFMVPFMPQARGQGRGNSGIYLNERYELQVLDSFGLEGNHDDAGGFYTLIAPSVNMAFPPLTWQTYDIDFTPARWDGETKTANARVTVRHNGVLIHDNAELTSHTPGRRPEGAEPLGIYLQRHTGTIQFRNIWKQYRD